MRHIRRPIRRVFWIIGALFVMTGALLIGALIATTPHFLEGAATATAASTHILGNPQQAAAEFTQASKEFNASLAGIRSLPEPAQLPSFLPPFSWYIHLNKAAVYLSRAGEAATSLGNAYPSIQTSSDPSSLLAAHSAAIGQLLDEHPEIFTNLTSDLNSADQELSHVPSWVVFSKHRMLEDLKNRVHQLAIGLPKAVQFVRGLRESLGSKDTNPHTALILFQNDSELRPSGGFIGSYAVITGSSGNIRSFKLGTDIYALDKSFTENIAPPPPLTTITPTWAFRDSNAGAGFLPDIGAQVSDFYRKETGITPSFIVFTDLSMLEGLLSITGPVTLPGTTTELTNQSVGTALTTYIERDYWNSEQNRAADAPKSIIGELIPLLLGKLRATPSAMQGIPHFIEDAVQRQSLQIWSSDPTLTASIFPTDTPPGGDWLKIVNTNIGGKKSSKNISQNVTIADVQKNDRTERTVTITRTHHGTGIWPDDENRNYMEIYIPTDAEVIQKPEGKGGENILPENVLKQFSIGPPFPGEVRRETNWIRIGFWATTSVDEQTTFVLTYSIPQSPSFTYLKQAGVQEEHLKAFSFDGNVTSNLTLEKKKVFW
jgi:hypothetical protein